MNLTRLFPNQVDKFWDAIEYAVFETIPPIANGDARGMTKVYEALLDNRMIAWVATDDKNIQENGKMRIPIVAIVLTTFFVDDVTGDRNLLLWCVYSYTDGQLSPDDWKDGLRILRAYAKAVKCSRVIAYTDHEGVAEVSRKMGGEVRKFISFNLEV